VPISYRRALLSTLLHVSFPQATTGLVPISYRGALLSTLLHVSLIPTSHNRPSADQVQRSATEHSCKSFTQFSKFTARDCKSNGIIRKSLHFPTLCLATNERSRFSVARCCRVVGWILQTTLTCNDVSIPQKNLHRSLIDSFLWSTSVSNIKNISTFYRTPHHRAFPVSLSLWLGEKVEWVTAFESKESSLLTWLCIFTLALTFIYIYLTRTTST
jgi:hypothetical protein